MFIALLTTPSGSANLVSSDSGFCSDTRKGQIAPGHRYYAMTLSDHGLRFRAAPSLRLSHRLTISICRSHSGLLPCRAPAQDVSRQHGQALGLAPLSRSASGLGRPARPRPLGGGRGTPRLRGTRQKLTDHLPCGCSCSPRRAEVHESSVHPPTPLGVSTGRPGTSAECVW